MSSPLGRRSAAALVAALLALTLVPALAAAHPLGNFTINHYAGIRVSADAIALDVVIDEAEIPTFTERQRIDTDGDGQVSDAESEAERQVACGRLAPSLQLTVAGIAAPLSLQAAGLSFPAGAAGLQTMRIVCEFAAAPGQPLTAGTVIHFADTSNPGHIGWREIVVTGDGATITGAESAAGPLSSAASVSGRLTHYPQDLLTVPLAETDASFTAGSGGPRSAAPCIADAFPLGVTPAADTPGFGCAGAPVVPTVAVAAAVPGGVGQEISGLLSTEDLTPGLLILSLVTAMGLGAAHALTPGHGKTIMAAYLVGTRGNARHALALGLTVTFSHTVGVLALAGVILALRVVTPESYNHLTGILSGLIVIGIGAWLFARQALPMMRARLAARAAARAHAEAHDHGHDHEHDHTHDDDHAHDPGDTGMHSHGGVRHSHLPPAETPLTWRSLFALGLFGGLVPSINALIILLATVATGRAAYGLVLVVAFGAGMAIVLGGIGLGLVYASRFMERSPRSSLFSRLVGWAPALTAVIILAVGVYVTSQAILGAPVL